MENVGQGQFGEGLAGHSEEVVYDFKFGEDNHADLTWASLIAQLLKNPPAMQETPVQFLGQEDPLGWIDLGSIPWLERSPGEGNGYPLQYSCLENSVD